MTAIHSWVPVLILTVAIGLAGCTYPTASGYEVDLDGIPERNDGGFEMHGEVEVADTTAPVRNFTDVSLKFYDNDMSEITQINLGRMSTDSSVAPIRRSFNISLDQQPTYIILESPDFWNSDVSVGAYRWNGGSYTYYFVTSKDERFPE
ncbi:hypothetical protein [Haloarcula argentinensis]|uniref:Uncharacterized protein n=1 Tax=Haloarcula argentinensis TaxID=43776 RepID=A0ABU2F6T0_HALAR|nr:hypothetical protein [Haloarcula argentinensis]MDS0255855.1 hypothetical protein [Haloarcula argentinensis]